ncbi:hypothetical protein [Actinocorallia sp. A-T 12471]|uniref:baeRF3 domain-containing protein n=1 Tax=Actinocorallia sp. A-T 12471 TaxID=3089813 RepID=UPI0029CD2BD8|nr:hypothetical protein [Actinocorallia sp. A-T 12471]MDX6739711.1 hypothetical protein [Actinocorallia sp. A-T 12471]
MDAAQLARLHEVRPFPAVSIIMPTHRTRPERQQDRIRLKVLLDETRQRLTDYELDHGVADEVMRNLEKAAEQVDFERTAEALVLFAAYGGETHAFVLPGVTVSERVIIDDTFATRDLLAMLERTWSYYVLVLSEQPTRLFSGEGERCTEVTNALFPLSLDETVPEEQGGPTPANRVQNRIQVDRKQQFVRQIERNLTELLKRDDRPVIAVGVNRALAFLREHTNGRIAEAMIGTVEGAYEKATPAEISRLVAPVLHGENRNVREEALAGIDDARSGRRFAAGLEECWELAHQGRVKQLLVEDTFFAPSRTHEGRLHVLSEGGAVEGGAAPAPELGLNEEATDEAFRGKFVNDAVDDLIEAVLRHDGHATFVNDGSLSAHNRVAAILRY